MLSLSRLSYLSIKFSPFLCAGHHDTQELSTLLDSEQTTMPGCSLIIPWEGKPESQHWLVKFLAEGLGFLGREEVTICLQALSSLPPPTAELTVSLIGGFGCQAFWQAPSCHLKPTERRIVLFQVLRVRGTWPLLLGHREIKSAL